MKLDCIPSDVMYNIVSLCNIQTIWLLSRVSKHYREYVIELLLDKNISGFQKLITCNLKKPSPFLMDVLKSNNFVIYTLLNNITNTLIFRMKLNNVIFNTRQIILKYHEPADLKNFDIDMEAFSEGYMARSNFDFNIMKLSGNNSIVSDIIYRLRGTCSGITPEMLLQ